MRTGTVMMRHEFPAWNDKSQEVVSCEQLAVVVELTKLKKEIASNLDAGRGRGDVDRVTWRNTKS